MTPLETNPNVNLDAKSNLAPVVSTLEYPGTVSSDNQFVSSQFSPAAMAPREHLALRQPRKAAGRLAPNDYARLVRDIRRVVTALTPAGAIIAVISKGDSQLLALKGRIGLHLPQGQGGSYAGYHPADSMAAIAELENIRRRGADYLLLPNTAFWWLEYYSDFARHLETKYQKVWSDARCMVFQLSDERPAARRYARAKLLSLIAPAGSGALAPAEVRLDELRLAIDSRIPEKVVVGEGSAIYISGWCYHSAAHITRLEVVANDSAYPLKAWGIPRPDVAAAHYPHLDTARRSYRSGFWGFVPFQKVQRGSEASLGLRATLADGTVCEQGFARVAWEPGLASTARNCPGVQTPRVAICMATYNPPLDLFRRQIDSIRNQTFRDWVCLIADDGSRPDLFEKAHGVIGQDSRFKIHRVQTGTGFYTNFERCLSRVGEDAEFVALSDHDDYWHPDKLETLVNAFDDKTSLVYSDMRIVDERGGELSPTYWTTRPNNFTQFASLLMANTITGGASMFRRSLLPMVLPFPERMGEAYHDHWIGVVALAVGKIKYINRPLYDYVQHAANVIGHFAPTRPMAIFPAHASWKRPGGMLRETLRSWKRVYFSDLLRVQLMAQTLHMRCAGWMSPGKAAELRRVATLGESWRNLLWLARRAMANGQKISETIGAERPLLGAALWRHFARSRFCQQLGDQASGRPATAAPQPISDHACCAVETMREKIAPLSLRVWPRAPRRLNLLIPTIDLRYFFGGYITKFNLARCLAEEGLNVRIVVVDHCDWQPGQWREQLRKFEGLEHFFDRVEVAYAADRSGGLEVSPEDAFMATTWWTAHIAHHAMRTLGGRSFVYLIQEYEPFTFPMGSFAALAARSYEFPHYAIFSTELLQAYFRQNRLSVFAQSPTPGQENSVPFQNAITDVGEVTRQELANRLGKRLLYYARPEQHAARNMFELGILALTEAVEEGYFDDGWEFYGIGSVGPTARIPLADGRYLTLLPRENQQVYRDILRAHDLGLALMYTPHPSLVPIEMASAGMVVVTNAFANKTEEALREISSNLRAVHPSVENIKRGLKQATQLVHDYDSRVEGSRVKWATNWETAFNPEVMAKIHQFITASRPSVEAAVSSEG